MTVVLTKECLHCGIVFLKSVNESRVVWETRRKYCSKRCGGLAKIGGTHTPEHIEKIRVTSTGRLHTSETLVKMSGENAHRWKGGKPFCTDCGKRVKNFYAKRCFDCYKQQAHGENGPNWQGGKTVEGMQIRNSDEYKEWRTAVFERDKYTCQICGQIGGALHADHIKPFAYFPKDRLNLANGRTLCVPCHKTTDTYMGKARYLYEDKSHRILLVSLRTRDAGGRFV